MLLPTTLAIRGQLFFINIWRFFFGVISTIWFMIGGSIDAIQLFRDLKKRVEDPNDNGQILNDEK